MNATPQTFDIISTSLQQWIDAQIHLSRAIQTYASAANSLRLACTAFPMKSTPGVLNAVENNLKMMECEERKLHRTQVALKMKRNSFASPIYALPSELLTRIFAIAVNSSGSSSEYVSISLSWVCSRWRQIAPEVFPVCKRSSLFFGIDNASGDRRLRATIALENKRGRYLHVSVDRQPGVGDAPYAQTTLDTLAPYIKQLNFIYLNADVEQLRLFLEFWLEKGTPGSVTTLFLLANGAAPVFPETSSHLSERLSQFLRNIERLSVSALGLPWSSVQFDKLEHISLSDLPSWCSPTLVQLAHMLSACPALETIRLERITIPDATNPVAPELVELERLCSLSLIDVDVSRVLSIISSSHDKLDLELGGIIGDADTLESLCSFFGRANICELRLALLETRSNQTLAQLLLSAISPLVSLRRLTLRNMSLHDSELTALAWTRAQNNQTLPSKYSLALGFCTIRATPTAFYNAVSAIPWTSLRLCRCNYLLIAQGEGGVTEVLQPITTRSDFGVQLSELLAGRRRLELDAF
ncbi:hypothetical protein BDV93DRAFT_519468 [Ceratobasidium sp. AG-I]|nr:hypothetical protein BDV93DRAFT_519468 [Ceratobasidium sp. AG-I]